MGLLVLALAGSAAADDLDDQLSARIDEHRATFRIEGGRLTGPGADVLERSIADAQHVLLGEQHLTVETPALAESLLPLLKARGFDVFAVETGPVTADLLVSRLAAGELEQELRARPRSVPFFDHDEEVSLLRAAIDAGFEVWGLDQEFFFSGRAHLEQLGELASTDAARALVDAWKERSRRDLGRALMGEDDVELLLTATDEQLAELRRAFGPSPEATRIVDEVAESAAVYRLFRAGENYESNRRRVELMKQHLRVEIGTRGSEPPRVFFKFGSMHMGRGHSPLNQLDLGNHAAELAAAAGRESVHLVAMGLGFQPRGGELRSGGLDGLEPLTDRVEAEGWTLFDLRALRPHFHSKRASDARPALARLVWRYDFAIFAPVFHGATPLLAAN